MKRPATRRGIIGTVALIAAALVMRTVVNNMSRSSTSDDAPTGGTTSGQGGAASSGTLEQALNARGEYDSIASQMESGLVEQYNDYFALTDV